MKRLKMIILFFLVTFGSMAIFKMLGKTLSPIKSWSIGAIAVGLMSLVLVTRTPSGWGYASDAAGAVVCLVLVIIGRSQVGFDAAIDHTLRRKGPINARVVNCMSSIASGLNRQCFPLAPQVELHLDAAENLEHRQLEGRLAAAMPEVPQDKCIKLMKTLLRWNPLPLLAFRHLDSLSGSILPQATRLSSTQFLCGLPANSGFRKTAT